MFEHTKLPLTTWYLAIYLLTQSKNGLSAMDLLRQLGVSYNTAWMLKHKLMQAMRERDDSQPLGGIVEMDDADLGGAASGGKRGRGADRKTPFLAAAQVTEDGRPQRLRLSPVVGFRRRAVQAWAQQHLRPGTIVRADGLACFRGVQAARCTHQPRVTGGGKGSCETPGLIWVNTLLGNVKRAMDGTYHACAARYAGRYLAEFADRFNRRYQLVDLVPRLAYVAVRTPPLPFYLGSVPETGSPVRTWVRLVGLPQVAQATAAAGLGSLPSPAGGGRLGGLARPPRRRRVGPFFPRISGPCGSLVGPSHLLRDLNGSVGVAPYRKRTGTQE